MRQCGCRVQSWVFPHEHVDSAGMERGQRAGSGAVVVFTPGRIMKSQLGLSISRPPRSRGAWARSLFLFFSFLFIHACTQRSSSTSPLSHVGAALPELKDEASVRIKPLFTVWLALSRIQNPLHHSIALVPAFCSGRGICPAEYAPLILLDSTTIRVPTYYTPIE